MKNRVGLTFNMYFASLKYTSPSFVTSMVNTVSSITFVIAVALRYAAKLKLFLQRKIILSSFQLCLNYIYRIFLILNITRDFLIIYLLCFQSWI